MQCTSQPRASGARHDHRDENVDRVCAGLAREKAFCFKIINAYGSRASMQNDLFEIASLQAVLLRRPHTEGD